VTVLFCDLVNSTALAERVGSEAMHTLLNQFFEVALAYAGYGRLHKQQGNTAQAREYLTRALEIFERLGTLGEPDKVRQELAALPQG
jgi:class 3 adenylate cyclase